MRAQTSTQLFNQLQQSGYSKADLTLIVRALDLANRIFSCRYCESGKTQIDHVVGTASILSSIRAPAAVVAAGLIHNAYDAGDFGTVPRRISKMKRRHVVDAVGREVEARIHAFAILPWSSRTIQHTLASLDQLGNVDRDAVLMRLSDMLDHHSDLDGFYYHRSVEACRRYVGVNGPLMVEIARRLGHPSLAVALAEAFAELASADASRVFLPTGVPESGFVLPKTYHRRAQIALGSAFVRRFGNLRAKLGLRTRYRSTVAYLRGSISNDTARGFTTAPIPSKGIEDRPVHPLAQIPGERSYAHTRPQLLRQLAREGYTSTDVDLVVDAYELAKPLFAGVYLPSRKTLVAHHVGTASILASLHSRIELVAAGLIHAAYKHGDFGSGIEGLADPHREQIRRALGAKTEEYVAQYHHLTWSPESVAKITASVADVDTIQREVILMHAAGELETLLDLDPLYTTDGKDRAAQRRRIALMVVPVLEALGMSSLAAELRRMLDEISSAEVTVQLVNERSSSSIVRVVPDSYRRRLLRSQGRRHSSG